MDSCDNLQTWLSELVIFLTGQRRNIFCLGICVGMEPCWVRLSQEKQPGLGVKIQSHSGTT